jgi:hypothetical protein
VKQGDSSAKQCEISIATQRILVGSQIWDREVKQGLKLHNLRTNHVTIRLELRYLIGAKIVDLKCRVFGGNVLQLCGSGLEPDQEPNREFGPVANTSCDRPSLDKYWESVDGRRIGCGDSFHQLVNSQPWEGNNVTLPLSSHGEPRRNLKLLSEVNL